METKEISLREANLIIEKEESHFFDQKAKEIDGKKIQKISVAFANTDGGEFVIGIKDTKAESETCKRWDGFDKVEDCNFVFQALNEIEPGLDYSASFLKAMDYRGLILMIKIDKSSFVHCTASKEYYVRVGAQSLKLNSQEKIIALQHAKGTTSYEDEFVRTVVPEVVFENDNIKKFLLGISPQTDPIYYCFNENLLDTKDYSPRVAGLLLFANNPSAHIPKKCAVKIVRYETKQDEPERDFLKDTFTIEGPTFELIQKSVDKVSDILSNIQIWSTEGLKTMEYPKETIWEIITNAIIHRDYSISNDVIIYIYDNRIEVVSPGKLPGMVTVDNILDTRFSRNAKIVRTLSKYKDAPNKDIGEGLNTAFEKMKEWKLQPPTIVEKDNTVIVTIPHVPLASASELIMNFLKKNDRIANRQAREITGIKSENSIKQEFYKLRDGGYLERVPNLGGASSAWQLTQKGVDKNAE